MSASRAMCRTKSVHGVYGCVQKRTAEISVHRSSTHYSYQCHTRHAARQLTMFVRTSSLKLKVLYTLALFISCFPAVTSQRLMGISGEDCVDQAYDGLQKFWCAQNECNVNLCRYASCRSSSLHQRPELMLGLVHRTKIGYSQIF